MVQQAFVDRTWQVGQVDVGACVGRQVFIDGSNLLLANRNNNTVQTSLTGVWAYARELTLRADVFDLYYTTFGNGGIGGDPVDRGRRFSASRRALSFQYICSQVRSYISIRSSGVCATERQHGEARRRVRADLCRRACLGRGGADHDRLDRHHQGGSYGSRDLDAWQVLLAGTYRLHKAKTEPRFGLHFDYATGGGADGQGKLKTAFAPYGNNIY
ncbi:alginate export family protein [Sphingomonas faeni]